MGFFVVWFFGGLGLTRAATLDKKKIMKMYLFEINILFQIISDYLL